MAEQANETPNPSNCDNQAMGYLEKASEACANGNLLLGMHLYLAAYENAAADASVPAAVEVHALREAWHLACDMKERSMAEYAFEKLEPYLTGAEIAECAMKLQELALDRLEQYGFSREDLEDMAETISQDLLGDNGHVVKVESFSIPNMGMLGAPGTSVEATLVESKSQLQSAEEPDEPEPVRVEEPPAEKRVKPPYVGMGIADVNDFNPYDFYSRNSVGTSYHCATNEGSGGYVFTRDEERATALERAEREAFEKAETEKEAAGGPASETAVSAKADESPVQDMAHASGESIRRKVDLSKIASSMVKQPSGDNTAELQPPSFEEGTLSYRNLVGYDEAISIMRDFGVGLQSDPDFLNFIRMLNNRHGLNRMPALDTLLFRAPVIEDAARFADATIGEVGLPVLRMSMEEGMGGAPVLCVTTQGNNRPRMNHAHNRFEGPAILVIEDLNAWVLPEMPEGPEGFGSFMMMNISRGAREAVNLIRSAVEDPDVYVLATASTTEEVEPFFYELLEPITIVDIGYPSEKERDDIWAQIAEHHPSLRDIDRNGLVRFSKGLARYDMYMAAREAVEDAYKIGLVRRAYQPVTPQNIFDKLAACQPLDSDVYHDLEQTVVDDFRNDLDHLEDLLDGWE